MFCARLYSKYSSTEKLSEHIVSRAPNESHYVEGSVFQKDVKAQKWSFVLGGKIESDALIYVIVGFEEKVWGNNQPYFNDVFVGLTYLLCSKFYRTRKKSWCRYVFKLWWR